MKKLQLLVPQYNEDEKILRVLLDSVEIQQNVDFKEIGVIIVNDGSDVVLSKEFLGSYSFDIEYIRAPHGGVSATRNVALDAADSEYVMFCDADDMFCDACGLYIILKEIENSHFDTMVSMFREQCKDEKGNLVFVNREMDTTFVHGKVHNLEYLRKNDIRWNPKLTIHEDSYFNVLCQRCTERVVYCKTPFYLWRWRDDSVCRHDDKYILKTYGKLIDSSTELLKEFERRGMTQDAQFNATALMYDAYFTLNKKEWWDDSNQDYRDAVERRFARYYREFKNLIDGIDEKVRTNIVMNIRNRMYSEGLLMEEMTFGDWIHKVEAIQEG